jgi:predicted naringenin-chalcone synthase
MNFAILGLGTAVPAATAKQEDSLAIAQSLCHGTSEQETWLPTMYKGTGIHTRHFSFSQTFIDDMVQGTRRSGSVFLPTGQPSDNGPSTAQRMDVYRTEAPPLALRACQKALAESGVPARGLSHLITVSCTGFEAPGVDHFLIREMGLAPTIQRTNIGFMGCHGALNGLRVGRLPAAMPMRACCFVPSSCAACIATTAGTQGG